MADLLEHLTAEDRRVLARMAEAANAPAEVMAGQVVRAYLRLAKDCPAALPSDPLARRAQAATRGR